MHLGHSLPVDLPSLTVTKYTNECKSHTVQQVLLQCCSSCAQLSGRRLAAGCQQAVLTVHSATIDSQQLSAYCQQACCTRCSPDGAAVLYAYKRIPNPRRSLVASGSESCSSWYSMHGGQTELTFQIFCAQCDSSMYAGGDKMALADAQVE